MRSNIMVDEVELMLQIESSHHDHISKFNLRQLYNHFPARKQWSEGRQKRFLAPVTPEEEKEFNNGLRIQRK